MTLNLPEIKEHILDAIRKHPKMAGLLRSLSRKKLTIRITAFIENRPTATNLSAQSLAATKSP